MQYLSDWWNGSAFVQCKHCASVFNSPRYFRECLSCRAAMLSREVLCAMPASIEFEIPPDSANIGTISQLSPTFLRWSQVSKHRGDSISEVNSSNGRRVFRLQLGIARFPRALSMARRRCLWRADGYTHGPFENIADRGCIKKACSVK